MILSVLLLLAPQVAFADPAFHLLDLGVISTDDLQSGGRVRLNDRGQVAFSRDLQAMRYTDGVYENVSTGPLSVAWDINEHGQVLGHTFGLPDNGSFTYRYTDGEGARLLVPMRLGGYELSGMNDAGDFALGYWLPGGATVQACRYSDARGLEFLPVGENSLANDINNAGVVIGHSPSGGFLYSDARGVEWLPSSQEYPQVLNERGQIAGLFFQGDRTIHIYRRDMDGNGTDLGSIGETGLAMDMNDYGWVVGYAGYPVAPLPAINTTAFLATDGGGIQVLDQLIDPSLGWQLQKAMGVNNAGQIAGFGVKDGEYHAFRLDPVQPIPEPTTLALLLAGGFPALGLGRARLRKTITTSTVANSVHTRRQSR